MKTTGEVIQEARRLGVSCSASLVRKYIKLGLIAKGKKIKSHGNVIFLGDDTALRLWLIVLLRDEVGEEPALLPGIPWHAIPLPSESVVDLINRNPRGAPRKKVRALYRKYRSSMILSFLAELCDLFDTKPAGRKKKGMSGFETYARKVRRVLLEMPDVMTDKAEGYQGRKIRGDTF